MVVTKPNSGWAVFNYSFVQFHSHSTRIWRLPPQCRACSLTVISPKNFPEAPVPSYCHSRNQTDTRSTSELNPGDPLSQCCFCCDMIPRSSDSYPQLKQIMLTGHFVVPLPIKWSSFTGASSNLSCFFKNWGKWSDPMTFLTWGLPATFHLVFPRLGNSSLSFTTSPLLRYSFTEVMISKLFVY